MTERLPWLVILALALAAACTSELPSDVVGYGERCIRLNAAPIPPRADDPHEGDKNVYACNVTRDQLVDAAGQPILPYPDGSLLIVEATKPEQGWVWLLGTARKEQGRWTWEEYKRNFSNDDFLAVLSGEGVCVDCHRRVESSGDWIFTAYEARP